MKKNLIEDSLIKKNLMKQHRKIAYWVDQHSLGNQEEKLIYAMTLVLTQEFLSDLSEARVVYASSINLPYNAGDSSRFLVAAPLSVSIVDPL